MLLEAYPPCTIPEYLNGSWEDLEYLPRREQCGLDNERAHTGLHGAHIGLQGRSYEDIDDKSSRMTSESRQRYEQSLNYELFERSRIVLRRGDWLCFIMTVIRRRVENDGFTCDRVCPRVPGLNSRMYGECTCCLPTVNGMHTQRSPCNKTGWMSSGPSNTGITLRLNESSLQSNILHPYLPTSDLFSLLA